MESAAIRITIVYENFAAGIRAKEVSERLANQLKEECEINSGLWKFEVLAHPQLREQAASEAAQADMIIVSARAAEELPAHVRRWIESWLPQKRSHHSALVALLDEDEETVGESRSLGSYLRDVAELGSMDFFYHAGGRRPRNLEYGLETLQHQPESKWATLDDVVYEGWGINE
jgi:hypothetical protein